MRLYFISCILTIGKSCLFLTTGSLYLASCNKDTAVISCGLGNELNILVVLAHWKKADNSHCADENNVPKTCDPIDVSPTIAER